MATHYEALGVPEGASPAAVRAAYLRLARVHHPDRHADADADPATRHGHERRMREVNAAWTDLGDPERRRAYDDRLRRTAEGARTGAPGTGPGNPLSGWADRRRAPIPGVDDVDDDLDLDLDDAPVGPPPHRSLIMTPASVAGLALALALVGLVTRSSQVYAVGLATGAAAVVLFALVPLFVMAGTRPRLPLPRLRRRRGKGGGGGGGPRTAAAGRAPDGPR